MKKIMLTCKDPGQFFRDCPACKHHEKCDYLSKRKALPLTEKEIRKVGAEYHIKLKKKKEKK